MRPVAAQRCSACSAALLCRWVEIAQQMGGRSPNDVWLRWYRDLDPVTMLPGAAEAIAAAAAATAAAEAASAAAVATSNGVGGTETSAQPDHPRRLSPSQRICVFYSGASAKVPCVRDHYAAPVVQVPAPLVSGPVAANMATASLPDATVAEAAAAVTAAGVAAAMADGGESHSLKRKLDVRAGSSQPAVHGRAEATEATDQSAEAKRLRSTADTALPAAAASASVDGSLRADEAAEGPESLVKRFPKRKVACMVGFLGANYSGMQRNPGVHTVEDVLERALYQAGTIMPSNVGVLQKLCWTKAARTDKGVSAAGMCVAMKLVFVQGTEQQMTERVNSFLPDHVRIFSMVKVTNGFDSKNQCDKRRYVYMLPAYALAPFTALPPPGEADSESIATQAEAPQAEDKALSAAAPPEPDCESVKPREVPAAVEFDLGAQRAALADMLQQFVGTHNMHNFTTKLVRLASLRLPRPAAGGVRDVCVRGVCA